MPFATAAVMAETQQASEGATSCPHCGNETPAGARDFPFCCSGCRAVSALLREQGLTQYYELSQGEGVPASPPAADRNQAWLEPMLAAAEQQPGSICSLDLDVQGIHCAACVWLMNEMFQRKQGGAGVTVNPALGKIKLSWQKGRFDLPAYLREVEQFGYRFGPDQKKANPASRDLPMRIGVCAAIAMNVMMFSVSFYAGLAPSDGQLFRAFSALSVWLSAVAVLVGGWPFFKAAVRALQRGVLHLDLPIAVGILLAFGTSLLKARDGRGDLAYFDTLDIFVTLMLIGRWLQQRVLERNRQFLLDDAGAEGIHVRKEIDGRLVVGSATGIRAGDSLLIAPGDLIPVDATLTKNAGEISTDWINGESTPHEVAEGETIPAGAFNAGRTALHVRALTSFTDSPLPSLLRAGTESGPKPMHARLTEIISRIWVPAVLGLAALGLWLWWPHGPTAALDVTTALLIVTCPCALGIALPLAGELALARLRRSGVFVRSGDLLDRILRTRRVLFDKTGTLTLGRLELSNPNELRQLAARDRDALYDMTSRSNHPVSKCLASELARAGARFSSGSDVVELSGQGVELEQHGHRYRLGRTSWAAPASGPSEGREQTVFSVDGEVLATFELGEAMRPDARQELARLRQIVPEIWLVSGDAKERVEKAALALGIPVDHALSGQRPEDKAAAVERLGAKDALFIGDGVNDSLAFAHAGATGTPAVDRPVMPGKADFFLMGDGLAGIRALFETAQMLRTAMRRILIVAQIYNVLAIAASLAGHMTPLRAALAMPLSSVSVILLAMASLSHQKRARHSDDDAGQLVAAERVFT